ncbi:hemolymph juvenile hormone-binding protein, partial [Oryctes borbonicus]
MIVSVILSVGCLARLASVIGLDLPSYIPKCSLSDPQLNNCIKEKANIVIPKIAEGIPEFGIPSISPIKVKKAESKVLNLISYDAYCDDLKDIKVTTAYFDIKKGEAQFTMHLDRLTVMSQNYTFTNGMVLGLPISGHGEYNMTMVGITINY